MGKKTRGHDPNSITGSSLGPADAVALRTALYAQAAHASRASAEARRRDPALNPYRLPAFPKASVPSSGTMAQDSALKLALDSSASLWVGSGDVYGTQFLGYSYLAELAQKQEYRVISETIADDATRKWVDFEVTGEEGDNARRLTTDPKGEAERRADPDQRKKRVSQSGKGDKVKALRDDMDRLEVRDRFYTMARDDGLFGRSHIFMNFGDDPASRSGELAKSIGDGRNGTSQSKVARDSLKSLRCVEPMWVYPQGYNAVSPLSDNWYAPKMWYVMGTPIDGSRMLTLVSRPVPDMLKPAYGFGGVSLSQLADRYIDIWLRTKKSVADMVHSFSIMVLMTDLSALLGPQDSGGLVARADMFNAIRDNQGLFIANKETEDFKNVSASLSGLSELQAQAQEHIASVSRIPLVKLTGVSPSGLNASSEGEIRIYYDTIAAYQHRALLPQLSRLINFQQLSLFGEVDPEIKVAFEPLWELTDAELGDKQKADAERHQIYLDMGVISSDDVRRVIVDDPELPYTNLDPDDVPDLKTEEESGLEPVGGRPQPVAEEGKGGNGDEE